MFKLSLMKRTVVELRKFFRRKISAIEKSMESLSNAELLSEVREGVLTQMAVDLRSMFCWSAGCDPLIVSAQLENSMLFPLHNVISPFNELSQFLLVGCQCTNNKCTFTSSIDLSNKVASSWLSFNGWIHEIVIDLKIDGFPPLSRYDVIKIIADKEGAHVDKDVHPFVELIETTNVMPVRFYIGETECESNCSNLLYETIYSIAKEVLYSYKFVGSPLLKPRKVDEDFILGIFAFSIEGKKKFKYTISSTKVNLYNTNRFYPCSIVTTKPEVYGLLVGNRTFAVKVIRVEELTDNAIV